jgi:RNA polymerase sigma factor (sigma-70 family)
VAVTPLLLRTQTDDRLLRLAAAGHDRAFEAIVERYRAPLLRYLHRLLSEPLAEDVVQATFVSAWRSLGAGTEVRDLRPWLYRIAHNQALNALKRAGDALEALPDGAPATHGDPALELARRDRVRSALSAVAALPDRQRAALLAVAVEGRPHADVASELGLSDGAVRQLVHRARCALRTVASALTPPPLLSALASSHEATAARVAEVAAGAGGAGLAGAAMKAGVVAATAGALAVGAHHPHHVHARARPAASAVVAPGPAPATTHVVVAHRAARPQRRAAVERAPAASEASPRHQAGADDGERATPGPSPTGQGRREDHAGEGTAGPSPLERHDGAAELAVPANAIPAEPDSSGSGSSGSGGPGSGDGRDGAEHPSGDGRGGD